MSDWLRAQFSVHDRPLQDRLAALIAAAVASAVAITGAAAYLITLWSVYDQLDNELIQVAGVSSTLVASDVNELSGLDTSTLRAANASVMLIRTDGAITTRPGDKIVVMPGAAEISVARRQEGSSARTLTGTDALRYRVVAVPLSTETGRYALVLLRPLLPTEAVLQSMVLSLLIFGGMGVVVAAAAGYVIARSGVEPVARLTNAVTRVTETDDLTPIEATGLPELVGLVRAFNTMLRTLASSRERQRRLIADAGHELRTPLTSMRTNVELLVADEKQGMLPPGARAEILRDVAAQLGEFTTLIGDLVHLSREDRVEPHPEPIDLRDVVNSAVARAQRRGPGLVFDVHLDPFYLVGEPDSLERAITNLLDNAVKFSPPHGKIRVLLKGDRLRISDQGPGIADEDLPHVFDRFYRSDQARTTPGSGLGLSIVAQTIKAHGGWVKAGRAPGGGAEFTVRLPGSTTPPEGLVALGE